MAEAPDPADLDVYEMPDTNVNVVQSVPETDREHVAESAAEETALEDHVEDVADGEAHAEDVEEAGDDDVDEATPKKEADAGEKASAEELDEEDGAEKVGEEADEEAGPDATEEDAEEEAGPDATEMDEGEADPGGATEEDAEEADPDVAEDDVEDEEAAPDAAEEAAEGDDALEDDAPEDDTPEDDAPKDDARESEAGPADDSSSLSEDLPTIRLTFQGQDFAVFPSGMQDSGPFVYLDGEEGSDELVRVSAPELRLPPTTFWEPLDAFFAALRVKDALGEFLEDGTELCLSFPDLELDLMEDNVYARDITLHDISQLALGFGHQASLHVLVSEEVRFISRYNELAMRINGAADSVDTNQNVAPVEEDESAAPAAGDDGPDGVDEALHDMYDMDDDAGDVRRVPYDDADHAAYEDEADASVPRAKRAADEPDIDEATKRTKTASDAT